MPVWLFSKYFYLEMNPRLRYALVPFPLLFNVSALFAVLAGLDLVGVRSLPIASLTEFLGQFGAAGTAAYMLLVVNVAVAGLLLLVGVPLYPLRRDIKKTIDRFGVFETELTVDAEAPYEEAAREVFAEAPETAIFRYGHAHRPTVQAVGHGLLVTPERGSSASTAATASSGSSRRCSTRPIDCARCASPRNRRESSSSTRPSRSRVRARKNSLSPSTCSRWVGNRTPTCPTERSSRTKCPNRRRNRPK